MEGARVKIQGIKACASFRTVFTWRTFLGLRVYLLCVRCSADFCLFVVIRMYCGLETLVKSFYCVLSLLIHLHANCFCGHLKFTVVESFVVYVCVCMCVNSHWD